MPNTRSHAVVLLLLLASVHCAMAQPAPASRPGNPQSAPAATGDATLERDKMLYFQGLRSRGQASWQFESFTEAELAAYWDVLARMLAQNVAKELELTPAQQEVVRRRLEELKTENRAYWKRHLPELREVAAKENDLPPRGDPQSKDPAVMETRRALSRQRMELIGNQPLHARIVRPVAEGLLSPEQREALKARQRAMAVEIEAAWKNRLSGRAEPARGSAELAWAGRMALGPWEAYVQAFIRVYNLDDPQKATARSILRDLQAQRDQFEASHKDELRAAQEIEEPRARFDKFAALNEPVVRLFDDLKARLERIPTVAQREAVAKADLERAGSSTRPTSRPAPSRTRRTLPASKSEPER